MDTNSHRAKIQNTLGTFEFEGSQDYVESQVKAVMELLQKSPVLDPKPGIDETTKVEENPTKKTPSSARTQPRAKSDAPKLLSKLIDDTTALKAFVSEKNPQSHPEIFATVAAWMKDRLTIDDFSIDEMFTAYRLLGRKEPKAMTQVFRDAKAKGLWFDQAEEKGKFTLTRHGESMVAHELPRLKPKG